MMYLHKNLSMYHNIHYKYHVLHRHTYRAPSTSIVQYDGKLETFPFRGTLCMIKKLVREELLQNNPKNIYEPNASKKTLIYSTQLPIRLKLIIIDPKWTRYTLKTHITTSILWTINMVTLTLLIHMKNTIENIMRNK